MGDGDSYSAKAICGQSKTKRRYVTQKALVEQIKRHPGDTRAQASWRFIGGKIDEAGQCVPLEDFARYQLFFNATRRLTEVTGGKNPKVITGDARLNPHTDAAGLFPVDYDFAGRRLNPAKVEAVDDPVKVEPVSAEPVKTAGDLLGFLEDVDFG